MNKKIFLLPLIMGFLASCERIPTHNVIKVESVSLSETYKNIEVGETFDLTAAVSPDNATNKEVTWKSSDASVAKYENGVVSGLKVGTSTITVKTIDQNKEAKCTVKVFKSGELIHVTGLEISDNEIDLYKNDTYTIEATVSPSDATDKTVKWESSDEEVATVNNGKITAISAGFCTITAITNDLGFTASCEITVSDEVEPDPEDTQKLVYNVIENGKSQFTLTEPITKNDFTFTFDIGTGEHNPIYNYATKGKHGFFRLYPNTSMTISSTKPIKNIEFTHFEKELDYTADVGTLNGTTWTGNNGTIKFTVSDGASGHVDFEVITIKYEDKIIPHEYIDLGTRTIKEVKDYIEANPVATNSHQCGVDEYTFVTIKGYALAKISLIKTTKAFGLNVSEPSKIIMGDTTDAIGCATKTGDGTFFNKVNNHQMKNTSRYTVSGYISIYLGQPEIVVTSFQWDEKLNVELDIDAISKDNISVTEFYEKATNINYNCAGHGYGDVYTIKGLTCYYDEPAGQGKDWYNFTNGTENIRVNAYNISTSVSIGKTYDVTGIISLQNLSPIIVAFKINASTATPINLNDFYKSATSQSINDLLKIKGSQDDTDTKYPAVINSYSSIYKTTGYMCIVEENGKLYVGISDTYKGENFIVGKNNAKTNYGIALIKNDKFWNKSEDELALFNIYYDKMCENIPVEIYYVNRQLGYNQNKPMWEILLIPQSIPQA